MEQMERRAEVKEIIFEHCSTCQKLAVLVETLKEEKNERKNLSRIGFGIIITLLLNIALMTGLWREVSRISNVVSENTKIVYENKGKSENNRENIQFLLKELTLKHER